MTYCSRLCWLVKNEQVQEALDLVEKMVNEKVNPDEFTYDAVIKGCVKDGKLEEAKMLYEKMAGDGIRLPCKETYGILISFACNKNDIEFALELCKQCVELHLSCFFLLCFP